MHRQLFQASRAQGVDAGVIPDVRAIAPMLAQLEIIDVPSAAVLPHEDQFVLAAIEAAHASVGLVPNTEVLELAVDRAAGGEHLPHVPPIHADLMDRPINGVPGKVTRHRLQKCREFGLAHLAATHRELAVPDATEAADVAVDGDVVRRIREYEFRLGGVHVRLRPFAT